MGALGQLGATQQRMLRQLLLAHEGASVEMLCERLRISHNAVRQHLSALIGRDYVERAQSRPSGGRPQARFRISEAAAACFRATTACWRRRCCRNCTIVSARPNWKACCSNWAI